MSGDYIGAGLVVAAGVLGTMPGPGTISALGINSALMSYDLYRLANAEGFEISQEEAQELYNEIIQDITAERSPPAIVPEYNDQTRNELQQLLQTADERLVNFLGADTLAGIVSILRLPYRGEGAQAVRTRQIMADRLSRIQTRLATRVGPVPVAPGPVDGSQLIQEGTRAVVEDQARAMNQQLIEVPGPTVNTTAPTGDQNPVVIGQTTRNRDVPLNRRLEVN